MTTKPQITIRIDGPAGSGKSTLAEYLAADLKIRHGLDVRLFDEGSEVGAPTSTKHLEHYFNPEITIIVEQK